MPNFLQLSSLHQKPSSFKTIKASYSSLPLRCVCLGSFQCRTDMSFTVDVALTGNFVETELLMQITKLSSNTIQKANFFLRLRVVEPSLCLDSDLILVYCFWRINLQAAVFFHFIVCFLFP